VNPFLKVGDFENLHSEQYRNCCFHQAQERMACSMKFSDDMIVSGLIIMKSDPDIRGLFEDFFISVQLIWMLSFFTKVKSDYYMNARG
jgi:hypothetical protein